MSSGLSSGTFMPILSPAACEHAKENTCVMIAQTLDDITFRLREPHDFGFLQDIGQVFHAFDEQDSGNICFGVDTGSERLFVKYAGARTIESNHEPQDAIDRLKRAMPVYEDLRHPSLIELREHYETGDGYAAVFEWFPGEGLHQHWAFTPEEKYSHPDSPSCRHKKLSIPRRLETLDTIFAFHQHVIDKGHVAIDFYDGSIIYDFNRHITKICDIDFYARRPYTNKMGRMWGSTRFMSPEEFEHGAAIDEVTNVFVMGATAFAILGGEIDRSREKWEAGDALYEVACKAINPDRSRRYGSLRQFREAWDADRGGQSAQ